MGAEPIVNPPVPVINQMLIPPVEWFWNIRSRTPSRFISAVAIRLQPAAAVANQGADSMVALLVPPIDHSLTPLFCEFWRNRCGLVVGALTVRETGMTTEVAPDAEMVTLPA